MNDNIPGNSLIKQIFLSEKKCKLSVTKTRNCGRD